MRDELRFKSATSVRRVPQRLPPPAHTGMKTLYSTRTPGRPMLDPGRPQRDGRPQMYKTEYQSP
uniref:Uncharacterized protein n=1 Tax=Macrostomum lignano TaxID=282301 RepID=A0A1I8FGC7_9PLAT